MRSRILIILFTLVSCYIISNTSGNWNGQVFKWDKSGYHLHLPAVFIYKDVTKLGFYSYIDDVYRPSNNGRNYCIYELENGNRINRYSIGVAVLNLPFFLTAHFINTVFLDYAADGYSLPYQWATILGSLFWAVLGLLAVRKFLLRHFTDNITTVTLLAIAFGTNLYFYVVLSAGGTHAYSFFLFALVLVLTDSLYNTTSKKYFYGLGIVLGLIGITRVSNLLIVLLPLLWGINSKEALIDRFVFIKANAKFIALAFLLFMAVMMLQMGYWKYLTGHWLYNGYKGEGFIWTEPAIWKGLFGFQKGWFVYTPLALFMVWGLYSMRKRFRMHIPAIVIFMIINIYIIFSWWHWSYGASFSTRPLVEALAILSFPLAAFIERATGNRHIIVKTGFSIILTLLIALNMFQSYQASKNVIHWDQMSRAYYFRVFFKTSITDEDQKYLMSSGEYYSELNGRYEKVNKKHRDNTANPQ